MIQTIPPTGLWGQTLCILLVGLGLGWGARALQSPDFTQVTEAAPTADTSHILHTYPDFCCSSFSFCANVHYCCSFH